MPKIRCQGAIALATVVITLLGSKPANAQYGHPRGNGGFVNNLVIGTQVEIVDQRKAEQRLQRLEARGERDAGLINRTRYRIDMDEWLIRYNSCQQLTPAPPLPCVDAMTCAAKASVRRHPYAPSPPILPDYRIR